LGGKADPEVAAACKAESRVLITLDTDFANLGAYLTEDYSGIIVLRLANQAKPQILSILHVTSELLASAEGAIIAAAEINRWSP
jgi:predicted nuclease of predicted toxin-antitoxin system